MLELWALVGSEKSEVMGELAWQQVSAAQGDQQASLWVQACMILPHQIGATSPSIKEYLLLNDYTRDAIQIVVD